MTDWTLVAFLFAAFSLGNACGWALRGYRFAVRDKPEQPRKPDTRYSFPVVLRDHRDLGPMLCPWCGKCRNYDFHPVCHCYPLSLNEPTTEVDHVERWKRDCADAKAKGEYHGGQAKS